MKHKLLSIIMFLVITGCSTSNDIYPRIYKEWIENNKKDFIFDFSESMGFDWDVMYVFSAKCSLEDINETLNLSYSDFIDVGDRIVFLKSGKIVYTQAWYSVDFSTKNNVIFSDLVDKLKFQSNDAKFMVEKKGNNMILSIE